MCGVVGILSAGTLEPTLCSAMNTTLRHRGPDDEGYLLVSPSAVQPLGGIDTPESVYKLDASYGPVAEIASSSVTNCFLSLGHRRLSIVDLSPLGHQPMHYAERYWIVYNGEVYNHIELRAELESRGYQFNSHTDTEVILAAYDCWGEDCLERFNGMWAFALYDTQQQTLFMARDRFGVKPFYYWVSPAGILAFASEIKAFTVLPGWEPAVNGQRVYDFLAWSVLDHTDETMFSGVFQIRGGCCVKIKTDSDTRQRLTENAGKRIDGIRRWYSLTGQYFSGNSGDAVELFKNLLEGAVNLRLRADVPVGSCLSGGLDSSSIVCVANRLLRQQASAGQQKTFSACATVKRFDERSFIDEVVAQTGVDAYYTYPELEELIPLLDDLTWHQDEPFGSTSIYAQWAVFQLAAKNGVKVMLDGQGADEQLAGYHSYFGPLLGFLFKTGRWLELLGECQAIRRLHGYSYSYLAKRLVANLFPALRLKAAALAGTAAHSKGWLDHDLLGAVPIDPFLAFSEEGGDISALSRSQLTITNVPMLLHWEDRDSMAHSIESRVPFLDYRLVEYVLGLPDKYKLSGGVTKLVMREGMRGILPEKIRTRMDKLGFVTPEEVWLKETGSKQFEVLLTQAVDASGGIIKPEVMTVFDQMVRGERPFNFFIWRVISFGSWLKRFGVSKNLRSML